MELNLELWAVCFKLPAEFWQAKEAVECSSDCRSYCTSRRLRAVVLRPTMAFADGDIARHCRGERSRGWPPGFPRWMDSKFAILPESRGIDAAENGRLARSREFGPSRDYAGQVRTGSVWNLSAYLWMVSLCRGCNLLKLCRL